MSRRRRAIVFALLACVCGLGSALIAGRWRAGVEAGLGEMRTVVVTERALEKGESLDDRAVERSMRVADLPIRYLPPDALGSPLEAVGAVPVAEIPAGSYLLASQLRPDATREGPPRLKGAASPIEVTVQAAGSLGTGGGAGASRVVDVIAAREAGIGTRARVEVIARRVPLLGLRPGGRGHSGAEPGSWLAVLGLDREQALAVIEAENFARELRLLPR